MDFSLVRGGVITGRVTDSDGRPAISGRVQLQVVNEQGQKWPYSGSVSSQMFETDDRGVYRVYGLRAGRYLVSAGGESGFTFFGSSVSRYPRTWHPEAADENQARVVEVAEGGEVTDVDIKFGVAKATSEALGRVINEATGQPIPKASLMCDKAGGGFSRQATTDGQGNFRFDGLTPGHYEIMMFNLMAVLSGGGENKYYIERTRFEVKEGDVENIEIRAKLGATISGVAVIEGASDASVKTMLTQTMIAVRSRERGLGGEIEAAFGINTHAASGMIKSDGSFQISGVRPGIARFDAANFIGKTLPLVRIERNGVEVSEIEVKAGENISGVRLVFGHGTAVIRGQVNVVGAQLPEGWRMQVMASSEKSAGRLGGSAQVDGKGRFVIEGLLPGEYTLTLRTTPGANLGQAVEQPAPVAQQVTVGSGAEVQVTLTLELKKKAQEERQ